MGVGLVSEQLLVCFSNMLVGIFVENPVGNVWNCRFPFCFLRKHVGVQRITIDRLLLYRFAMMKLKRSLIEIKHVTNLKRILQKCRLIDFLEKEILNLLMRYQYACMCETKSN